jgi:assimilatory nitrate reductase catalytic subunit
VREALAALMAQFPLFQFTSCVPFSNNTPLNEPGRERMGVLLRAAAHEPPPDAVIERIEALIGLATADTLRYADQKRGQRRAARLVRHGNATMLEAIVLHHGHQPIHQGNRSRPARLQTATPVRHA